MDVKPLEILQWNAGKRREAQLSLLNDQRTNKFDFLLLSEPYRFTPRGNQHPVVPQHQYWEAVLPSQFTETAHQRFNFRSMIYVNRRVKYRQIPIPCSDLTAVTMKHGPDRILLISAYIERDRRGSRARQILEQRLADVRQAVRQATEAKATTHLILAGDFNRHDQLWGGHQISESRRGEAESIIQFMIEHQLWSALPQGTKTYRHNSKGIETTLDLMLISP